MRRFLLLILLASPAAAQIVPINLAAQQHGVAGPVITVIQHRSTFCFGATTCTLAFSSNVGSGHTLVYLSSAAANPIGAPTDNNTNTIVNALTFTGNGSERVDYVTSANSGATSVTAKTSSGSGNIHIHIWEISSPAGPLTFDVKGTTTQTGTSLTVSTSSATNEPNEIVFGFFFCNPTNVTFTAGSGFSPSEQTNDTTGGDTALTEVQVVGSTGTQTATATSNSSQAMDNIVVTFGVLPTFVAATGGTDQSGTSLATVATTGTLNVAVNDILFVFCTKDTGGTGAGQHPTDTAGNTFTRRVNNITASTVSSMWSSVIANASTTDTISCNYSPSRSFLTVLANQFRNVTTLDVTSGSLCNASCTTTQTSGAFTTTSPREAILDCHTLNGTVGWTVGAVGSGTGIYSINSTNTTSGTNNDSACQYVVVSAIQTAQTATMTASAGAATWSDAVISVH